MRLEEACCVRQYTNFNTSTLICYLLNRPCSIMFNIFLPKLNLNRSGYRTRYSCTRFVFFKSTAPQFCFRLTLIRVKLFAIKICPAGGNNCGSKRCWPLWAKWFEETTDGTHFLSSKSEWAWLFTRNRLVYSFKNCFAYPIDPLEDVLFSKKRRFCHDFSLLMHTFMRIQGVATTLWAHSRS